MHLYLVTRHHLVVDNGRCVIAGILALAIRVRQDGGPQHIIRMGVCPAHTLVDHLIQRQLAVPLDVHADVHKNRDNTGVLAQRPMALGAHARIDQNLGHGILRRLGLFPLVGFMNRVDEILGVVIGNELQRVRYAFNQVVLADYGGHRRLIS